MQVSPKLNSFARRNRKWLIATADLAIALVSIQGFLFLRYLDVESGKTPYGHGFAALFTAILVGTPISQALYVNRGRFRVGSQEEALAIAMTVGSTAMILGVINELNTHGRYLPISTLLGASMSTFLGMCGYRLWMRALRDNALKSERGVPTVIYGAGNAGAQLVDSMMLNPESPFLPVALLDDDPNKRNLRIRGVPVVGTRKELAETIERTHAEYVVVALAHGSSALYAELSQTCRQAGVKLKTIPPLSSLLDGRVGIKNIEDLSLADILGRKEVETSLQSILEYLDGRRVLVTGAGGSIGSELCRQLRDHTNCNLIMLDRDESALHALELSLSGQGLLTSPEFVLADIRDTARMHEIFDERKPNIVFHAAALKHLPMLEQYPDEAWKTNVLGTRNVLEAAKRVGVEVFANISTDKAANPVSVLGYSKRVAERLTAHYGRDGNGRYVSVRFGNVLASRGSVLETFSRQIAAGGPVTVTDPEVTRFFMTIPEAVELVIQAAAFGEHGDVLVLDMGEPVRIAQVAEHLINLSNQSIDIVFTGLREGEKLHEDLFGVNEESALTQHPMISRVAVEGIDLGLLEDGSAGHMRDLALHGMRDSLSS